MKENDITCILSHVGLFHFCCNGQVAKELNFMLTGKLSVLYIHNFQGFLKFSGLVCQKVTKLRARFLKGNGNFKINITTILK